MANNSNGTSSSMAASAAEFAPFAVRTASVERITNETKIQCTLALDVHPKFAPQEISVKTGIGFLDHVSRASMQKGGFMTSQIISCSTVAHRRPAGLALCRLFARA